MIGRTARHGAAMALLVIMTAGAAQAEFVVLSRTSEIEFTQVAVGAPDAQIHSTQLHAPFHERLEGDSNYEEPGGALNFGSWSIVQDSEIGAWRIDCAIEQRALTNTDFGSPAIYTYNLFEAEFQVPAITTIRLDGALEGCQQIGCWEFVRVLLLRDAGTLFNSGFGHTFPYEATLEPAHVYTLRVELSGRTAHNSDTFSQAWLVLSKVTCPGDLDADGALGLSDLSLLLSNFGLSSGVTPSDGDLDDDGDVDLADLAQILAGFGTACD